MTTQEKKGLGVLVLLVLALILLMCTQGCASVPEDYVRADRKTHQALAPHIEARIATLPAEQGQSLRDLFESENIRIEEAERALGLRWNAVTRQYEELKKDAAGR